MNRFAQPNSFRAAVLAQPLDLARQPESDLMRDAREFLTGWLGGLVFFGTFLA